MAKIVVNGIELEYVVKGQGEPVVLIHGSASDYRTWQAVQDTFAEEFLTITYSRRFHWPNQQIEEGLDYSMSEHIEDLKALLTKLNAKPVHLVGHSYGALMALGLAIQEPQYVASLVLAEPPAISLYVKNSNDPKPKELLKLLVSKPRTGLAVIKLGATGLGPAASAAKRGDMNDVMRLFGHAALGKETFSQMSQERKEQVLANLTKAEFLGSGFLPLNTHELAKISKPVLLLTGQKSPKVFSHLANRLDELLPDVKRVEVANASHILHENNPTKFSDSVISYLKQHPLRA
ncbi:MAG: alpha/beta hydrolase [Trueperaceae bacterium]|nr:alpha/beta hydrolase [Trueperaceae bacterium]